MQAEVEQCDEAAAAAQQKAAAAREQLQKLYIALLPLRSPSCNSDMPITPAQLVIPVTSDNLADVMEKMNLSSHPAIYDFQGKEVGFTRGGDPTILSQNITWRNGKVVLSGEQSLVVKARDIKFDSMYVVGGLNGVWVGSGGSLSMIGCGVCNVKCGVRVEGNGSLIAQDLKLNNCSTNAFALNGDSKANVTDCDVSGSCYYGVFMESRSSMVGTRVQFIGNHRDVLWLKHQSRMSLRECSLMSNCDKPGFLRDDASLMLSHCAVRGEFSTASSASVHVER